ncbi:MAG TPA: hypothetical protein VN280_09365 [Variovorax sp.]|nr:hypothetical protein [Variovorax sp.]
MNDLLRIDGWENSPAPGWGMAGETDMGVGEKKGKKRKKRLSIHYAQAVTVLQ